MNDETKLRRVSTKPTQPVPTEPDDAAEPGAEFIGFRCPPEMLAQLDAQVEADKALGYPPSRSAVIRRLIGQALKGAA